MKAARWFLALAAGGAAVIIAAAPAEARRPDRSYEGEIGSLVDRIAREEDDAMDGPTVTRLVTDLRAEGADGRAIRDVLRVITERGPRGWPGAPGERGMGAFIRDAKNRGLRGRALAEAIHREQARIGVPGQVRNEEREFPPSELESRGRATGHAYGRAGGPPPGQGVGQGRGGGRGHN